MSEKEIKNFTGNFYLIISLLKTGHEQTGDEEFLTLLDAFKNIPVETHEIDKIFDTIEKKIQEHSLVEKKICTTSLCDKMKHISQNPPHIKRLNDRCRRLSDKIVQNAQGCADLKKTIETIDSECDFLEEVPIPVIPILAGGVAVIAVSLVHMNVISKL